MDEPLTTDEEIVYREFTRLDVEPNQIPPDLYAGFLERLAETCNLSLSRARVAIQGLIDKGIFDVPDEGIEERKQTDREIILSLLLHDPEIRQLLKKIVAEMYVNKT